MNVLTRIIIHACRRDSFSHAANEDLKAAERKTIKMEKSSRAYSHLKNIARIRCVVSSQDLEKLVFSPAGWITVMDSSLAFPKRP